MTVSRIDSCLRHLAIAGEHCQHVDEALFVPAKLRLQHIAGDPGLDDAHRAGERQEPRSAAAAGCMTAQQAASPSRRPRTPMEPSNSSRKARLKRHGVNS